MSSCSTCFFCYFDIGLTYLAHGSITKRGCVKYIHDPDMTLTFDFKVTFIGFMTWLCVQASPFLSFVRSHTLLCKWVYHHGTMCHIQSWTLYDLVLWPQYQNYIFTMNLNLARFLIALWHRHTKFLHLGVSPWDMLCTFSSLVWLWPLTYMWVEGGILSEFYSQFLSCFDGHD